MLANQSVLMQDNFCLKCSCINCLYSGVIIIFAQSFRKYRFHLEHVKSTELIEQSHKPSVIQARIYVVNDLSQQIVNNKQLYFSPIDELKMCFDIHNETITYAFIIAVIRFSNIYFFCWIFSFCNSIQITCLNHISYQEGELISNELSADKVEHPTST